MCTLPVAFRQRRSCLCRRASRSVSRCPWRCLNSMQSSTPSVSKLRGAPRALDAELHARTVAAPPRLCAYMARCCRPCAFWLSNADRVWLGYADRVWIGYADRVWLSNADRVCLGNAGCMVRRCRPCAVIPPLTLGAGSTPIPNSETGRVHIAGGLSTASDRPERRSVRRRCPLQHPFSSRRRGTGVAGAPASDDGTLWCGSQLAFHATCLHGCCGGNRLSHPLAGEWPVLRAQLAACAPD